MGSVGSVEARRVRAKVAGGELALGREVAADQTAAQNTVGGDGDVQVAALRQDRLLDPARDQGILDLHVADRMSSLRAADRLGADLRESYVAHVARLDELRDRADALLDRHVGIEARRAVDVDVLDTKACQRVRQRSLDRRWARVVAKPGAIRAALCAELDAQHVILARAPPDSLGDQQLVVTHPVEVACVQQVQPGVERRVDRGDALAAIRRTVHARHTHAAKTQSRDLGTIRAQPTEIHETATMDPNIETGALSSPTLPAPR